MRRNPALSAALRPVALAGLAALACAGSPRAAEPSAEPSPAPSILAAPDSPPAAVRPRPRPAGLAAPDPAARALFAMPRIAAETRRALETAEAGDTAAAAGILDALIAAHPRMGLLHANRAAIHMLADEPEAARAALRTAAARGFAGLPALLADPLFAPLAGAPRLASLAAAAPAPAPAPVPAEVLAGTARVDAGNTGWNPEIERLTPRFSFPARPAAPVLPVRRRAANELLREHVARGRAAGNHGDLYDNRDRGHSSLARDAHPQLAHVTYAPEARAADIDYGLNDVVLFDAPTLGNSSTAVTGGALWRSLPRAALTRPDGSGPARLFQNYAANHVYIYPAHRDFSPEFGDLLPANTPYILVSRGSSGSDRPFLEAVAMILAAFRPDTKARLEAEGLIAPTVQMVFRRSLQGVRSREAYLGGRAHPAAFDGADINLARMITLANSIAPDAIPPMVRIRMIDETQARQGLDYFGEGLSEQLFDTPSAIGRVWRARAGRRSFTVSAAETRDPNGRPLAFEWRLLQGDPDLVEIAPFDGGRQARITLDWQEPQPVSGAPGITAARIDIGVFANNGVHDSAPAILSVALPAHEARRYEPGADGDIPRLAEIDYAAHPETYVDPMLTARADWRDELHYDTEGAPIGWTRTRRDGASAAFTAAGARILAHDAEGRPSRTAIPAYPLGRTRQDALVVEEQDEAR